MRDWTARAAALAQKLAAAGIVAAAEPSAGIAASLCVRGARDALYVDAEEGEDAWTLAFADSYQRFALDDEEALVETAGAILRGQILGYAVAVGDDREVCGWCEREFLPAIRDDYRDDPLTVGGVLVVRAFDGEAEEYPLGEAC